MIASDMLLTIGYKAFRILAILIGAILTLRFFRTVVQHLLLPKNGGTFYFDERRTRTVSGLLQSLVRYLIYFIAIILILQEFQIDTTSLVAGAGILGLAIGVGAQSLIRDFITGFFVVLEDQYAVGDYIVCGDMAGTVEEIGLRVTKLRDANGVLHITPHGLITRVTNYTRGHMQAAVNIPIDYQADLDKALALLRGICSELAAAMPEILEGPSVVGVVDWRDNAVWVRIVAKTVPLTQVKVETELRYRITHSFAAAGIAVAGNMQAIRREGQQ